MSTSVEQKQRMAAELAQISTLSDELERIGADSARSIRIIVKAFEHESPIVREGAIYGFAEILNVLETIELGRARVVRLADLDPSDAVRTCAREALE